MAIGRDPKSLPRLPRDASRIFIARELKLRVALFCIPHRSLEGELKLTAIYSTYLAYAIGTAFVCFDPRAMESVVRAVIPWEDTPVESFQF